MDMLLDILAKTDALFWPCRSKDTEARRAIAELRTEYRELGLAWRVGGDSATRQAKLRELEALAETGRLVIARTPGRQSVFVKLPDAVDTELRRQVCLADYDAAWGLLGWIKSEADAGRCYVFGKRWVRETHLAEVEYGSPDTGGTLGFYAECMLPLLVRGLAVSNADSQGRVWYALTPAGEPLAAEAIETNQHLCTDGPEPEGDARQAYLEATERELSWLENQTPRNSREIGPIPMPKAAF
jgi:hypothetical protein